MKKLNETKLNFGNQTTLDTKNQANNLEAKR